MRTLIAAVLVVSVFALPSCRARREEPKEEKIRIVVEHKEPGGKEPGRAEPAGPAVRGPEEPGWPRGAEAAGDEPIDFREVKDLVRVMVEGDQRLRELIGNGNILPVSRYIQGNHRRELDAIGEKLNVRDSKRLAVYLARMLIHTRRGREQGDRSHLPPRE